MNIDTVTIHHPELLAVSEVPPSTLDGWLAIGWVSGPFPVDTDNRPPRAGRGSGFDAWLDYATSRDIIVDVGASRDDIIAAVDAVDAQIEARQPDAPEAPKEETPL